MGMRSEQHITELSDAISMHVTLEACPLDPPRRMEIIDFLQQEWERGDMDWLLCMRGAYSDTLYTDVAMGKVGEEVVAEDEEEVGIFLIACLNVAGLLVSLSACGIN